MTTALVSPKFQIVIPKEVRNALGLKAGQKLQVTAKEGHIELHPVLSAQELIGYLKDIEPLEFQREPDREL